MFRLPVNLLVGKCNADCMERDVAPEIQYIPAGTTFVDGASPGYECSWRPDPDVTGKQKTRHNLSATRIDIRFTASR